MSGEASWPRAFAVPAEVISTLQPCQAPCLSPPAPSLPVRALLVLTVVFYHNAEKMMRIYLYYS